MRVTTQLRVQRGARKAGEISGHEIRGPAVERERGDQHAAVAHRNQLRDPRRGLLLEQLDRIATIRRLLPIGMGAARDLVPRSVALLGTLLQ